MIRLVLSIVVAAGAGLGAGAYVMYRHFTPALADGEAALAGAEAERDAAREDARKALKSVQDLEYENADLADRVDALYDQLAAARRAPEQEAAAPESVEDSDFAWELELARLVGSWVDEDEGAKAGNASSAKPGEGAPKKEPGVVRPVPEAGIAGCHGPRGARTARVAPGVLGLHARFAARRTRGRNPEERQQLRLELRGAVREMRILLRDQQKQALHDLGAEFGVTQTDRQDDFANAVRRTMRSPLFRTSPDAYGQTAPPKKESANRATKTPRNDKPRKDKGRNGKR